VKVTNTATAPVTYQWNLNGTAISGQTTSSLSVTNVQTIGVSSYSCTASNPAGAVISSPLRGLLTVTADTIAPVLRAVYPANNARVTNMVATTYLGNTATGPNFTETARVTDSGLITNVTIQRVFPSTDSPITATLYFPNSFMSNGTWRASPIR